MRWRWKVVRWSLFAIVLASIAMGLFVWLPPAPRWVARGPLDSLGFSLDGKILRTQGSNRGYANILWDGGGNTAMLNGRVNLNAINAWQVGQGRAFWGVTAIDLDMDGQIHAHQGPVRFWDVSSGREVRSFLDDVSSLDSVVITRDGKTMYAVAHHGSDKPSVKLHRVDLDSGAETHARIEMEAPSWQIHLSPGRTLVLLTSIQNPLIWSDLGLINLGDGRWRDRTEPELVPEPRFLRMHDAASLRLAIKEDGRHWDWQWAPDGEALLLYAAHDNGKATLRRVTAQQETITIFDGAGSWLAVAPDGKTLFTAPPASEAQDGAPPIFLWDIATGKRRGEMPGCSAGHSIGSGSFCADNRIMVYTQDDAAGKPKAVVWNLDTKTELGSVPQVDKQILVSRKHDVFAAYGGADKDTLAMYRPQPFARLWQRDLTGGVGNRIEFLTGAGLLLVESGGKGDQHVLLLDVQTGETRLEVPVQDQHRAILARRFLTIEETFAIQTDNRGWFWETIDKVYAKLAGAPMAHASYKTVTRVFDTESGAWLGRLELHGATFTELSPDGHSVFMQEDEAGGGAFCCYDVPAALRWGWILGLPASLGMASVTLRAGWKWMRRRPSRMAVAPKALDIKAQGREAHPG